MRGFNKALDTVAIITNQEPKQIVKNEARLLLQRAQTGFTPPQNAKQGRAKIAKDVYGTRQTGGLFVLYNPTIAQKTEKGQFVKLWASKDRAFMVKRGNFWPDATNAKMREWHRSRYSDKGKRVSVNYPRSFQGNGFTDLNRPAVQRNTLERYIRFVSRRVGRLKAGWNAALKAVGGKIQGMAKKHTDIEGRYGLVINKLNQPNNAEITIGNQAPTISSWRKSWQSLINSRARDMVKRAEFMVKKAKRKAKL